MDRSQELAVVKAMMSRDFASLAALSAISMVALPEFRGEPDGAPLDIQPASAHRGVANGRVESAGRVLPAAWGLPDWPHGTLRASWLAHEATTPRTRWSQ